MRKLFPLLIISICVFLITTSAFNQQVDKKIWVKIDSLENEELYRSALQLTEQVYRQAKSNVDTEAEIKALIYQLKYIQELEENGQLAAIAKLEKELPDDRLMENSLKHSMLAELYNRYYSANRWEISQNPIEAPAADQPVKSWSPDRFYQKILQEYGLSLQNANALNEISIQSVPGLWTGCLSDTIRKSSVYDVLVSRALDFMQHIDEFSMLTMRPAMVCSAELFGDPVQFIQAMQRTDTLDTSPYSLTLRWYGEWLNRLDHRALVTVDLERLKYVHTQSCHAAKDSLYEAALLRWVNKLGHGEANADVCEALAQYHLDRGSLYRINGSDTLLYKFERKMAADWLLKAREWPETRSGKNCLNQWKSLVNPELSALAETYQIPLTSFPVSVEFRNVKLLYYRIIRMNAVSYYTEMAQMESAEKLNHLLERKPLKVGQIDLPDDGLLNPHRTNILIDPLPSGFYLLLISDQPIAQSAQNLLVTVPVSVTGTLLISNQNSTNGRDFYFRDRDKGFPLAGLTVIPWYSQFNQELRRSVLEKGSQRVSGKEGFLELPDGNPGRDDPSHQAYYLQVIHRSDTLFTNELFYPTNRVGHTPVYTNLKLYTDRSLYKPGEEAFFRGVLLDYYGDSVAIHREDSIALTLQDPRYQTADKMVLPVDSMGVFTGSFRLPIKGLTGSYLIHTRYGQINIRMEQYRRPDFSINLIPGSTAFQPGQEMYVEGVVKALSGEPVSGAEIVADIDVMPLLGGRRWSPYAGQKIRVTTVKARTDQDGKFFCRWTALPEKSNPFGNASATRYAVVVKATDLNGETHMEETTLDCGKNTSHLVLNLADTLKSDKAFQGTVGVLCTDGRTLQFSGVLKISKLRDPDRTWSQPILPAPDCFIVSRTDWQKKIPQLPYSNEYLPSSWPVSTQIEVATYRGDSIMTFSVQPNGQWKNGWYKAEWSMADSTLGKPITKYIYVEEAKAGRIGIGQSLLAQASCRQSKPGQVFSLNIAAEQKGFAFIEVSSIKGVLAKSWVPVGSKAALLSWAVTKDWQGGAVAHVIMVRTNRVYEKNFPVTVPWENTKLTLAGVDSLNRVQPGDNVSLTLQVSDENGRPVRASVGVTVYDASLDQIAAHSWPTVSRPVFSGGPLFKAMEGGISGSVTLSEPVITWVDVPDIEPVELNWFGLGYYGISRRDGSMLKMSMAQPAMAAGGSEARVAKSLTTNDESGTDAPTAVVAPVNKVDNSLVIRNDFRETALFAGNLIADKEGLVRIHFKVPDAFTRWKILAVGHDSNLAFGSVNHVFTSAKDLMIKSNFPAFMRKGDSIALAARLGWYGKQPTETMTSLNLTDSVGKSLGAFQQLPSKLAPGAVAPLYWNFSASDTESVVYQIQSTSQTASDGLRDTIKVYPDQVQLWNAQPFFFSKPGKKKLSVTANPVEALFEVSTTPIWQVLKSLPVIVDQERDCSEYWFSRLYLTCLAGSIADRFPDITKQYIQDSVPAKEKTRKQQIVSWMDNLSRAKEIAYVMEKLINLQNPDGTWPWFKGMGSDWFMTQQIVAGLGELKAWGIFDVSANQSGRYMLTKAVEAMDKWLYQQYLDVVRLDSVHPQKVHMSPLIIHTLYARSYFPAITMNPAQEIARLHFNERIPVEWTRHDPGLQALIALACVRSGKEGLATPIYKSLRERAKTDDQWGMYWPRKGYGSSFFEWDLWMQSRMMELFASFDDGARDLDLLKIYLIHQKRGRDWGNGLVAAWACKSLLFYGSSSSIEPASVEMTWGNEQYSPLRIKTGSTGVTGYYHYEWKKAEDMPKSGSMSVTKNEGGPAWGTLFTLNNYQLGQLSGTSGPLELSREIMIRDSKGAWTNLQDGQKVVVGDRVRVKLTIHSDRELSYIEIKDYLGTGCMPVQITSGYQYKNGLSYYSSREPESLVFYVSQLPKGDKYIEYEAVVEQAGSYFGGYALATSLYAPEFRAWSGSIRIDARR